MTDIRESPEYAFRTEGVQRSRLLIRANRAHAARSGEHGLHVAFFFSSNAELRTYLKQTCYQLIILRSVPSHWISATPFAQDVSPTVI